MSAAQVYAVIGNPVSHTKSPQIHGLFAQATQQQMEYRAVQGRVGHFAEDVRRFVADGGRGLNITAPFKMDAFAYASEHATQHSGADCISGSARLARAVNALKFENGQVRAENFDGAGLVRDVVHNLNYPLRGQRVLLLGAGGAVRGALLPFLREQPAMLLIANRTPDTAHALVASVLASAERATDAGVLSACGLEELGSERSGSEPLGGSEPFDLVFNATSASLHGQTLALPARIFGPDTLAYELLYGKGLTPFLQQARRAGAARLADGVGMLVEQAALAFAWWRGVHPPTGAVIKQLTVPLE